MGNVLNFPEEPTIEEITAALSAFDDVVDRMSYGDRGGPTLPVRMEAIRAALIAVREVKK